MVVRTRLLPCFIAAAAVLAGCVGAPDSDSSPAASEGYPLELTSCGVTSQLPDQPTRAITMNQGATEVALALGVQDQLAGTAYLDDAIPERWKAGYDSVPVLSAEYPDTETVLNERPDFIYSSYASAFDAEAAGDRGELEESGIASYVSPLGCPSERKPEVSWETVWGEIDDVAAAFGVPERARGIRQEQQDVLDDLADQRSGAGLRVFWFDSGDKTAFAGAGAGGPQLIMSAVGAQNVFGSIAKAWADVSWEQVVEAEPDVIVVADAAWSTAEDKIALLENDPALSQLAAVREKRFVTVPFAATTPGVRLVEGATTVAEQLAGLSR